eukprot:gene19530-biopygen34120
MREVGHAGRIRVPHDGGKPDAFVHSTGLDDLAADKLARGDEVRYRMVDGGDHGEVARVTELLRTGLDVPEDYKPRRRPAEVGSYDKCSGYLVSWNDEREFGTLEMDDGTTVLLAAEELRGDPINYGDKVKFEIVQGRTGKPKATNITVVQRPKGGKGKKGSKKGGAKGKGKGRWNKGGPGPRRHRRRSSSSSRSHHRRRQRRRKSVSESEEEKVIKKVKKETKTQPEEVGQDEDAINAAADASAALAVMTAFRARAHAAAKKQTGLPK